MGLFNHLFKNKPPQGDEGMEEKRQETPSESAAEPAASSQPDLTIFLHPKAYVPRGGAAPVHPGARPAGQAGGRPAERRAPQPTPPVTGEIVLTLGDVLSRIPTQLLKSGTHDAKRELRFKIGDLSSDIARGRAVVPLSRIATHCPDIFQKEVTAAEDMDIRLPLQKLVEQIGLMRSNSPAPLPEKVSRPAPAEAPNALLPTRVPLAMRTPAVPPRPAPAAKGESKPAAPDAPEIKPRAASPSFAPPEISKALQENILKAQPAPLRRIPAAKSDKVIPFPAIAAKAEIEPPKSDEERVEHGAERALEKKLQQLLAQKAAVEGAVKPELTTPSHLVTALAEIALQQSLLKTVETKETRSEAVSLAQPANLEASQESIAKSQLLGLLRMRLDAGDEAAPLIESGNRRAETGEISESAKAPAGVFPVETELKQMESRTAETAKAPAAPAAFEVMVSQTAPAAGIDVEAPGEVIAQKSAESQKPEAHAAEVSVLKTDAISAFPPITRAESAPEEKAPKQSDAIAQALDATLKDLATPERPNRVPVAAETSIPPAEIPRSGIPKAAEAKGPQASAAEVFEDTPESPSAALVKGIVSNADSISPPKAEITQTEAARNETPPKADVIAVRADQAALTELARPKPPAESVLKAEASAALPVAPLSAKTAPVEVESKKPKVSAVEAFEATLKAAAASALSEKVISNADSISPPKAEFTQTEAARNETEPKADVKAVQADLAAPSEFARPKPPAESALKAEKSAALPVAPPGAKTAPVPVESQKPEVIAMEAFEATLSATAASALSEKVISNADSISPPQAEFSQTEAARNETRPKTDVKAAHADRAAPAEFAKPKPPAESVLKAEASAALPVAPPSEKTAPVEVESKKPEIGVKAESFASFPQEMLRAETETQRPDLKKSEASPPGAFKDPAKGSAMPEISEASASKPAALPRAEIAHLETTPREQEWKSSEPGAVEAREQTLEESVNENIRQSEPGAPSAMEAIDSEMNPHKSAPGAPDASAQAASASDARDEWSKMPAIPGADKIKARVAPEPAVPAEAQPSRLSGEPQTPHIDAPAEVSHKDESIAALLVSLTALTESGSEASSDSAFHVDEESLANGADSIWVSLAAILKNCPKEIFAGDLPRTPGNLGIELPIPQIEPQLASGSVEISSLRFIAALPPEYMQYFVVREGVNVSIPMEEILPNLPESMRERIALSAKPQSDTAVVQTHEEAARPEAKPESIHPIAPTLGHGEANAVVGAAAEALSDSTAETPPANPPAQAPTPVEITEMAQKSEPPAPQPEAPAAPLAETAAPDGSSAHPSPLAEAAGGPSRAEMAGPIAPSDEPAGAVDPREKAAEPVPEATPEPESIKPPFALNIPTFRVFAPPPLRVNPSIVSAPATSVPLAWAGHVSTQPSRSDGPRQEENEALHSPAPPEGGAPKPEASVQPPSPDLEASHSGPAPPFEGKAAAVAATPEDSTPSADAARGRHFHSPATPSSADSLPREGSFPADSAQSAGVASDPLPNFEIPSGRAPGAEPFAVPVKSAGEADVARTTPGTQKLEGPEADARPSTPSGEHIALIRPPMIRPMVIPPPSISAFAPAIDSQAAASLSERSSVAEPSAPAEKVTPPIPLAFASASESVPTAGSDAENQGKAMLPETKSPVLGTTATERAPDSPKTDSFPNDPTALGTESEKAVPRIAERSSGEKASIPAPPKIPLSIPRLPVLHFPPAPKAEAPIPAPEPIHVPPPLPLVRFDQDVLQRLFMTDELLDLSAVCRHVSTLPGIQASVISRQDEKASAGEMPAGFDFSELLALAPGMLQVAGRLSIGALKHFTLYAETHSVSFFERRGVCLGVVHRARSFIPGVREKLVTVADELSK